MEHTDWLHAGFDSAQARFLMLTAITHHRFSSRIWGAGEVRKLHAELAEIDAAAKRALRAARPAGAASRMAAPLLAGRLLARTEES